MELIKLVDLGVDYYYTVGGIEDMGNLHNPGDDRVFSVSPQIGKDTRPFVGIVIICDDKQYCIPLSSPKNKYGAMKNSVDFHKVLDTEGKLIGVLDFNNMIPVREAVLKEVDIKIDAIRKRMIYYDKTKIGNNIKNRI